MVKAWVALERQGMNTLMKYPGVFREHVSGIGEREGQERKEQNKNTKILTLH